jgi:adenosylhomocysteine nucleosidase
MIKIGIIGAMEIEVLKLKNAMESLVISKYAGLEFYEGSLQGCEVIVVRCGIGKVNAAICTQLLASVFNVTHIINTGIAGAIFQKLRPCDIVLSTDALYHDFDATGFSYPPTVIPGMNSVFEADKALLVVAEQAGQSLKLDSKMCRGRIATGDIFVASKTKKSDIQKLCNPMCVEMEGAAIAHTCYVNDIPFVIIRCISDMADDSGNTDYTFNEKSAAETSPLLVTRMLEEIQKTQGKEITINV